MPPLPPKAPHIVHLETGRYVYGGARQVLYLLEHLPQLNTQVSLVCPQGSEIGRRAREQGNTVYELPMRGDLDLPFAFRFAALLRRIKPDLVHVQSRRGADVWGGLGAKMAGVPALLSRRVDNAEGQLAVRLKYPLYRHVIAVAQGVKEVLVGNGVAAEKITVVHSAINPALFTQPASRAALAAEFGLHAEAPLVGIAAQLIARKGHSLLLDALLKLPPALANTQLLVFGRGPLSHSLPQEIAARGLQNRVHLAGFRDDLPRWLGALDVLAHPAYTEGLANVCLQAAAASVASIGTRVGGIPEAIAEGRTGLLVPVGDSTALAAALAQLLSDTPLRQRLGQAGPAYVAQGFTAPTMAAGNRAVYRQLLGC